jgi:RNA polymerase sigma-70 factor (ECF subfamily)
MCASEQANMSVASDPAEWVDRHGDALYRFAMLRLRDPEQAEDAVQECFTAALSARESFGSESSERTWLVGILKRKIVDHLRKQTREQPAGDPPEADTELGEFFDKRGHWSRKPRGWRGKPDATAEDREFWAVFRRCLEGLSPRLAEAFLLRELDRMKSEEICKDLGLSPTNLWARLHRARLGLRRCLERNWFTGQQ